MRVVSGMLASPLHPGDPIVSLLGHARPFALETPYAGCGLQAGQPIWITLITLPGANPESHPLLEFDVECAVRVSTQAVDPMPQDWKHDLRTS
ncbi:MAG TPA: hypothetical protein VGE64_07150 [Xanthomonadaceae bacterium]